MFKNNNPWSDYGQQEVGACILPLYKTPVGNGQLLVMLFNCNKYALLLSDTDVIRKATYLIYHQHPHKNGTGQKPASFDDVESIFGSPLQVINSTEPLELKTFKALQYNFSPYYEHFLAIQYGKKYYVTYEAQSHHILTFCLNHTEFLRLTHILTVWETEGKQLMTQFLQDVEVVFNGDITLGDINQYQNGTATLYSRPNVPLFGNQPFSHWNKPTW